jgi:hypothetical protein
MAHELFGLFLLGVLYVLAFGPYRAFRRGFRLLHEYSSGPQPYPAPSPTGTAHERATPEDVP